MIDLKNKKILITGGDGFIGKKVIDNLAKKRNVLPERIFVPIFGSYDLKKMEDCQKAVKDQDIVIHLAALTGNVELHRSQPGRIFYDNITMGIQLMEAARQAGVEKFVGIGSITAYPEKAPSPLKEDQLWDGYPAEIHAPYSFAKKMLLVQGQAYRKEYDFNAIHLLFTSVFGPGTNPQSGYVISAIIKKVIEAQKQNKDFIEAWGNGEPIRDFLYVEDAAEGIVLAAEKYNNPEPINIGSGAEISIKELVALICKLMNFKGEVHWDTTKPSDQLKRIINISNAKEEFNFTASTPLKEGLKKTIEWHLRNLS